MTRKTKNNFKKGLPSTTFSKRNGAGFTMIEMIVAVSVFSIGILGVFSLVSNVVSAMNNTSNRLVASYLAQEGMEIVRNIRDSNFLKINMREEGVVWDQGLTDCSGGCEIDYTSNFLVSFADRFLKVNNDFYQYDLVSEESIFKRKIKISEGSPEIRNVSVTVWWEERGIRYEVQAEENLHNWY